MTETNIAGMVRQQARTASTPLQRRMLAGVLTAAAAVMSLGAVGSAQAQDHGQGMAQGHGDHHEMGPGMMMFSGPPEHVTRAVDHMLDGMGATDAQRSQIKQIALTAAAAAKQQHGAEMALHEQAMAVFTAPTVDAAAAESLRQQMLAQHDQASKRTFAAMLDVARVLTPEQRAKVAAQMKQHHAVMQERHERMQREHGASQPKP